MSIRLSKKNSIILTSVFFVVLAGAGGYLLWRVNNQETLAEVPGLAANCYVRCQRTSGNDPGHIIDAACTDPERCAGYTDESGNQALCEYETICDAEPVEVCGNGTCVSGVENVTSCPADCSVCGDNQCTGAETLASCPNDCSVCGDNQCTGTETLATCAKDCAVCGDNICSSTETAESCSQDCLCEDLAWTNKPDGTYPTDNVFSGITITNINSKSSTSSGITATLNSTNIQACTDGAQTCYTISKNESGYQVISIKLFDGNTNIEEGTYALELVLPVDTGLCASETVSTSSSFVIKKNAVVVVPETGIFDGVMGRIYLGIGFVSLGVVTTQFHRISYGLNTLGKRITENSRIVIEKKELGKTEKKRSRFERRFK